jgi:RNA polymerase sigma-B factor
MRRCDVHDREKLIVDHLPLARRLARRYRGGNQPLDDLVQVASLGLVKAAERWDPKRGNAFSTYAVPTILGELRRHLRDRTWDVRPPRHVQDLCLAVARARSQMSATLGREPTVADLAARLHRSPEEIAEGLRAGDARWLPSLDEAVDCDLVGRDDGDYERVEARVTYERLSSILDDRAREIIRMRYEDDLLQSEIATRVGLSPMGVSRILRASLEALAGLVARPVPVTE